MNDLAIKIDKISKKYYIGEKVSYLALRDMIGKYLKNPLNLFKKNKPKSNNSFIWALKDIFLNIKKGEVLGIIGRNGAGKTTLLKILSKITRPTKGYAQVYGRVGSLLEVGTGFHPELTGRENIYLNGAILGMKKNEIDRKFDEIVEFSEVEKFLDTPVKFYSSGMYIRLAFAVAAHLEPEILLVDEVLAVGDAAFQKKCLGKMGNISQEGRTVLFVSHNMVAVKRLSTRVIWIDNGKIVKSGNPDIVVSEYLKAYSKNLTKQNWENIDKAPGNKKIRITSAKIYSSTDTKSDYLTMTTPFIIEIDFYNFIHENFLDITLHIYNEDGIIAFGSSTTQDKEWHGKPLPKGLFKTKCHIPGSLLNSGRYRVFLIAVQDQGKVIFRYEDLLIFDIHDTGKSRSYWHGKRVGVFRPKLKWTTEIIKKPNND